MTTQTQNGHGSLRDETEGRGISNASDAVRIGIRGLGKSFGEAGQSVQAFTDLTLDVRKGEFFCILGPSGCGKTTLLKVLAGIEKPTAGELEIAWDDAMDRSRLAMVFQQHALLPWMTVEKNLRFVLRNSPVDPGLHAEIIDRFLDKIGLKSFRKFHPHQLSGGMNQRVSLVRSFCIYPQLLLMDEPFVFLDYQNRLSLQGLLMNLWAEQNQTIVFVTHNINEALHLGDRVMVMTSSPGRCKGIYEIDFERPRDVFEMRKDPRYSKMVYEIGQVLKEEVQAAEKMMEDQCLLSSMGNRA